MSHSVKGKPFLMDCEASGMIDIVCEYRYYDDDHLFHA